MEFCFGDSGGMMDEDPNGFNSKFLEAFSVSTGAVVTFRRYPWLRTLSSKVPEGMLRFLNPEAAGIFDILEVSYQFSGPPFWEDDVYAYLQTTQFGKTCIKRWRQVHEKELDHEHRLVLDSLESLNEDELLGESMNLLIAGSDTSATSLTIAVLEILSHPEMHTELVEELEAAIPDKDNLPPVQTLEKLPYLVSNRSCSTCRTAKTNTNTQIANYMGGRLHASRKQFGSPQLYLDGFPELFQMNPARSSWTATSFHPGYVH